MENLKKKGLLDLRGVLSQTSVQIQGIGIEMERQLDLCFVDGQDTEIIELVRRIKKACEAYRQEFEGFNLQLAKEIKKRLKED